MIPETVSATLGLMLPAARLSTSFKSSNRISQRSGKTGWNSVLRRYPTPDDPPVPTFAPMIRSTAFTCR